MASREFSCLLPQGDSIDGTTHITLGIHSSARVTRAPQLVVPHCDMLEHVQTLAV